MTDNQMYKELEKFANSCTVAKDVKVSISDHYTSIEAKDRSIGAKYEDAIYLSELIKGARAYLLWKRRSKK